MSVGLASMVRLGMITGIKEQMPKLQISIVTLRKATLKLTVQISHYPFTDD